MLNQTVLVGRLVSDPQINETNEKKEVIVTLAVQRFYKNTDGIYETDFIPCSLYGLNGENAVEYCHKGDLVGIKGRLESENKKIKLIAERVTFLQNARKEEDNEG